MCQVNACKASLYFSGGPRRRGPGVRAHPLCLPAQLATYWVQPRHPGLPAVAAPSVSCPYPSPACQFRSSIGAPASQLTHPPLLCGDASCQDYSGLYVYISCCPQRPSDLLLALCSCYFFDTEAVICIRALWGTWCDGKFCSPGWHLLGGACVSKALQYKLPRPRQELDVSGRELPDMGIKYWSSTQWRGH